LSLRSPSEFSAHLAAALFTPGRSRSFPAQHPFLGFRPLQRLPAQSSGTTKRIELPELHRPAPPGFLNLLTPLCPPRACRPSFMPDPLLGFDLQSFPPPVQPHAVSGAVALLSFETCPRSSSRSRRPCALAETETPDQQLLSNGLQQIPSPSGLCSTRKSATSLRRVRPRGARSSPGFHPLQGLLPRRNDVTFITPPLLELPSGAIARSFGRPFRVFLRGGIGSSRKRDRLPS
jgi:hypothetical protein